jgi:hypothetical protein
MPADPPSNTGSPDRSRPTASDLSKETTEGDLWNIDDEPAGRPSTKPSPPPTSGVRAQAPDSPGRKSVQTSATPARKTGLETDQRHSANSQDAIGELEDSPAGAGEEAVLIVPEDKVPAPVPREEAPAPAAESGARQNRPRPAQAAAPASSPSTLRFPKPVGRELIALGAFAFIIALASIWVITRFFTQVTFQDSYLAAPDYPVRGEHAVISSAETFWREPIREGPNRDSAKRDVMMIPVVEIALDSQSSSGALRITFRNQQGETVGDPMIRSFTSGTGKLAVAGTNGFVSEGDFNTYRTSDERPWTVEVREGPSADGGSASFKPLTIIPITPLQR